MEQINKEKAKVPAIRFKGFNDAWEQHKLGEVCKMNGRIGFRGYTEKDIISKEAGGVLTFSPTNIVDNQLTIGVKNTYITKEKYEESSEIMVKNGNILFVKTGSTLGKSALVTGIEEDCTVNPQVVVIKAEADSQKILSVALTTFPVQKQITAVKIGGAVPTMTETELKNIDLFLPQSNHERIKIGECFTGIDNLIALHQRKCDQLKNVKKSLLEKMFPKDGEVYPDVRFKNFTDAWEQRRCGDLFIQQRNLCTGTEPVLTVSIHSGVSDGQLSEEVLGKYVKRSKGLKGYILAEPGDLVFNMMRAWQGGIGSVSRMGAVSPAYIVAHPLNPFEIKFLNDLSRQSSQIQQYDNLSYGVTDFRKRLYWNSFSKVLLSFPKYAEQRKIGLLLNNLDTLITLHQRKVEQLKKIKSALLGKMFV